MGMYLNLENVGFTSIRKGLYVDKSGLISFINASLGTTDKLFCVSRPRKFGKTFAAKMLCAYYDKSCDSRDLFEDLEIAKDSSFEKYLNHYDVIYLDITWFISICEKGKNVVKYMQEQVIEELVGIYPSLNGITSLPLALCKASGLSGNKFIVIIDEWDALFRETKENDALQREYIQLLRGLFKSSLTDRMIEAAYMTGILPIKKYGTQSAITDFREYTMTSPEKLANYTGFTEAEVKELCETYHMDFAEMKKWYDGYSFHGAEAIYNPYATVQTVKKGKYGAHWTEKETYESLKRYIEIDLDGLKQAIATMLSGEPYSVDIRTFQNDLMSMKSKDDVLTLLIHLGYLTYERSTKSVCISNEEIRQEFIRATNQGNMSV
ncbi:MAG: AAA family ATPase [Lachnospiraceae bacterium]|nr:AAA family ATPase [Lachnospiraceae bacterium]